MKQKNKAAKIKGKALCLFDCHFPYVDRRAYELALKIGLSEGAALTEIIIGGDYADFYGVNGHGLDAGITMKLEEEVAIAKAELKRLRRLFPKASIVYLEGNHEYRLERYINKKAPELFGLATVEQLLELRDIGAKFIPFTPDQQHRVLGTKLIARHRPIGSGPTAAHNTVTRAGASVLFGDIHRVQEAQVVTIDGSYHRGIGVGWLGDKNHKVMQYVKDFHNWQAGCAVITALEDGTWFCNNMTFINYKVIYNGKLFRA